MKAVFALSMLALLSGNALADRLKFEVGTRIIYTVDSSHGQISSIDDGYGYCVLFDVPRSDGAEERCRISGGLLAEALITKPHVPAISPDEILEVGSEVVYIADSLSGVISAKSEHETFCVKFNPPYKDDVVERCSIKRSSLAPYKKSELDVEEKESKGILAYYEPDMATATLQGIDSRGYYCIRFDVKRYITPLEVCNIDPALVSIAQNSDPGGIEIGARTYFTVDGTLGNIVAKNQDNGTMCMKFDNKRSDSVLVRCGIRNHFIRKYNP